MAAEEPASPPHHAPLEHPSADGATAHLDVGPPSPVFEPIVDLRTVATVGFRAMARRRSPDAPEPAGPASPHPAEPASTDTRLATALLAASRLPSRAWLLVEVSLRRLHAGPLDLAAASRPLVVLLTEPVRAADLAMLRTRTLDGQPRLALAVAAATVGARGGEPEVILGVLRPEYLVLDEDVVDGVHANPVRRARLADALELTRRIGAVPIAFGVRRAEDERQLAASGVTLVAGRRYGSPMTGTHPTSGLVPSTSVARSASGERSDGPAPRDDDDVARAIGIGTALAGALHEAGIATIGELRRLGAIEAWERVRGVRPSVASGATLLQLEGATRDQRLTQLPQADRARLRAEARARLADSGATRRSEDVGGAGDARE